MILLDTNVLLRLVSTSDSRYERATRAIRKHVRLGDELVVFPQTVYELWTAATRTKAVNGLELSPADAASFVRRLRGRFRVIPDPPDLADTFIDFVERHAVTGPNAYGARLAAACEAHGVSAILTFNARDFHGLGLTVLEPDAV